MMKDDYTVKQLQTMLEHETSDKEIHYGANLSHWAGDSKPIQIDAGGINTLIGYYSTHSKDLDRKPEPADETIGCLIDTVEDWLENKGITPNMIQPNSRDDCDAIITGDEYDFLAKKFAETLGLELNMEKSTEGSTEKKSFRRYFGGKDVNTKVSYLYRDGSNYKVYSEVIVKGYLTVEQKSDIWGTLPDGEFFIPSQVGLPENRFEDTTEDDGPWFELKSLSDTDAAPTELTTAEEMYTNFLSAKEDGWDYSSWQQ